MICKFSHVGMLIYWIIKIEIKLIWGKFVCLWKGFPFRIHFQRFFKCLQIQHTPCQRIRVWSLTLWNETLIRVDWGWRSKFNVGSTARVYPIEEEKGKQIKQSYNSDLNFSLSKFCIVNATVKTLSTVYRGPLTSNFIITSRQIKTLIT